MDSASTELEREIKAPSKSAQRGVVFRHRQCFSSCPMPALKAALLVTGNENHNLKPEAHVIQQALCSLSPGLDVSGSTWRAASLHVPLKEPGWSLTLKSGPRLGTLFL